MRRSYLSRIVKVFRSNSKNKYRSQYLKWYKKHRVLKNSILMESTHGTDFYGHMLFIAKEILTNETYSHLQVYIAIEDDKKDMALDRMEKQGIQTSDERLHVISYLGPKYSEILARAKYLFNDTTFFDFFIKQSFQEYINIWHGTPLKKLGKYTGSVRSMANVQKNFYAADRIIVSNNYTRDALAKSYNLTDIYKGKIVVAPSVRNAVLRNRLVRKKIRNQYHLDKKEIIVYMPTWRGTDTGTVIDNKQLIKTIQYLEGKLANNQILFVKLHPFEAEQHQIDYSVFKQVREFPIDCETYDFLAASDCLVTDYSSVMYDYMNTGNPIILYTYDKGEYYASRGCYEDVDNYPFVQAKTKEDLLKAIKLNAPAKYIDSDFEKKFVGLDHYNGASEIAELIFQGMSSKNLHISVNDFSDKKETVLLCVGALWNNGITKAFLNTLDAIDTKKRNYVIFFERKKIASENEHILFNLPEGVTFYPIPGKMLTNLLERFIVRHYSKNEWFKFPGSKQIVDRIYKREYNRVFNDLHPQFFVHYTGFERKYAEMISAIKKFSVHTSIFVHTDMNAERINRGSSISWKMLTNAYNGADNIVLVSEQLRSGFESSFPKTKNKIKVVNNFLGAKIIQLKAKESIFTTLLNVPVTYANNGMLERKFNRLIGHSSIDQSLPNTDGYRALISKHYMMDMQNFEKLFPNVVEHFSEFKQAIENKEQTYFKAFDPIPYSVDELASIYPRTILRVMESLLNSDIKVYVTIGRMAKQKRQDRIIRAFEQIHKINSKTRLVIIAPHGSLRTETIKWIRNSTSSEAIFLLGSMDNPYSLLKMSDSFLFSSEYEGLGLVVFEALALNKEVITTYLPETVEVLGDQTALVSKNDDDDFVKKAVFYEKNGFKKRKFDFEGKDEQSIQEFESLFR